MRPSLLWIVPALVLSHTSFVNASPVSDLLFKGVKTSLSSQDKESIAKQVGLRLSKDRKSFVDEVGNTLAVEVRELHLNTDRKLEVLIIVSGSVYLFGNAGSGVQLYVKNSQGRYVQNLGFPAADVTVLQASTKGYRDLMIRGPGFECPVWRWDGKSYVYSHTVKCS